jgi:hypothetical protein
MLEIFDRWLIRRKINVIKDRLAYAQDDNTRRVLEQELAAERKTLEKIFQREDKAAKH